MTWIITTLGALVGRSFTLFYGFFTFLIAQRLAIATAYITVSGALFLATAVAVKAAVMGARVVLPPVLANATFFIPSSINILIASIVTVRVGAAVYRWTQNNLAVYADVANRKLLM